MTDRQTFKDHNAIYKMMNFSYVMLWNAGVVQLFAPIFYI